MGCEYPASVDDDEACALQARVVERRLEEERIAAGRTIEATASLERVDVHRHAEPASLACDVAEQEILKGLVLGVRRDAPRNVARVDRAHARLGCLVEIERA